jgi:hypothetical protein
LFGLPLEGLGLESRNTTRVKWTILKFNAGRTEFWAKGKVRSKKLKFTLEQAAGAHGGSRGIALLFL